MEEWYYAKDGEQSGPVSRNTLQLLLASDELKDSALVWTEGMDQWQRADQVIKLGGTGAQVPPPPLVGAAATGAEGSATSASKSAAGRSHEDPARELASTTGGGRIAPGSDPLEPGACFRAGFHLTKRYFVQVFLAGLILFGSLTVFGIIEESLKISTQDVGDVVREFEPSEDQSFDNLLAWAEGLEENEHTGPSLVVGLLGQVLSVFLSLGMTRIFLNAVDAREVNVGQIFGEGRLLLSAILAMLLSSLIIFVGFILFIIPGIIAMIRLSPLTGVLVDQELGPVEAIKESFRLTRNNSLQIVGLWLLSTLALIAGFLAFFVGLIFALPLVFFAYVVAYRWLSCGRQAALGAAV